MDQRLLPNPDSLPEMAHREAKLARGRRIPHPRFKPGQRQLKAWPCITSFPSQDGKVRKVEVRYKNPQPGEPTNEYREKNFATVPIDADKAKNGGSFVALIGQTSLISS